MGCGASTTKSHATKKPKSQNIKEVTTRGPPKANAMQRDSLQDSVVLSAEEMEPNQKSYPSYGPLVMHDPKDYPNRHVINSDPNLEVDATGRSKNDPEVLAKRQNEENFDYRCVQAPR
ncbi:unnamed protein product [Moneuplotes crassus]|uniref:Uncharacterized protein n=1 Tax=Euplotes crassus TaxID=5936 RepID=A0AAD1XS23_EUPCR|nr:unnamed protein product [Moneuplotes crassus]